MNYNSFHFNFTDTIFIVFSILVLFFFALKNSSRKIISGQIDISTSNFLKGFFILTIVFHHLIQRILDPGLLRVYQEAGYLSVGVFFLLSGYGLSFSKINGKKLKIVHFTINKLTRVYLPCLIVNVILFFSINHNINLIEVLIPNSLDSTQWFIISVLIFYVFYFLSTKIAVNDVVFVCFCTIVYMIICYKIELSFNWYISSLCFPLGIAWHKYQDLISRVLPKLKTVDFVIILLISMIIFILKRNFVFVGIIFCLVFSSLIILVISYFKFESKFLSFIGICSLEIYILHMKIFWVLNYFLLKNDFSGSYWLIPYFMILIVFSYLFYKFNNYVLMLVKS